MATVDENTLNKMMLKIDWSCPIEIKDVGQHWGVQSMAYNKKGERVTTKARYRRALTEEVDGNEYMYVDGNHTWWLDGKTCKSAQSSPDKQVKILLCCSCCCLC